MKRWFWPTCAALGFAAAATTDAEWPRPAARPRSLPGIPAYPYAPTSGQPKPTVTAGSLPRVDLGDATGTTKLTLADAPTVTTQELTTTRTVTKLFRSKTTGRTEGVTVATPAGRTTTETVNAAATFQMLDTVVRVDHCSLSKMSVAFDPDGRFAVRFRADQNPLASDPFRPAFDAATRTATTNLDANQFKRNKFLVTVRGYSSDASKAALVELPIEPFMVERGVPVNGFVEGTSDAVRRSYKLIERVDIDFTYR